MGSNPSGGTKLKDTRKVIGAIVSDTHWAEANSVFEVTDGSVFPALRSISELKPRKKWWIDDPIQESDLL